MQVTNYVFTTSFSGVLPIITTAPTIDEGALWVSVDTDSVLFSGFASCCVYYNNTQ
jgi:hypothetical protein